MKCMSRGMTYEDLAMGEYPSTHDAWYLETAPKIPGRGSVHSQVVGTWAHTLQQRSHPTKGAEFPL